jgi:hypothetical protein
VSSASGPTLGRNGGVGRQVSGYKVREKLSVTPSRFIDVYNATGYSAANSIPCTGGTMFSFEFLVNVPAQTYTGFPACEMAALFKKVETAKLVPDTLCRGSDGGLIRLVKFESSGPRSDASGGAPPFLRLRDLTNMVESCAAKSSAVYDRCLYWPGD